MRAKILGHARGTGRGSEEWAVRIGTGVYLVACEYGSDMLRTRVWRYPLVNEDDEPILVLINDGRDDALIKLGATKIEELSE